MVMFLLRGAALFGGRRSGAVMGFHQHHRQRQRQRHHQQHTTCSAMPTPLTKKSARRRRGRCLYSSGGSCRFILANNPRTMTARGVLGANVRRWGSLASSETPPPPSTSNGSHDEDENFFLEQVENTVQNVLSAHSHLVTKDDILTLPRQEREAVGVARHLDTRLQAFRRSNACPRCWMQRAHCICSQCPPVSPLRPLPNNHDHHNRIPIRRIFLILHHKEIALKVDTAKLLLAAFPQESRLVVGGIGPEYQASMQELREAVDQHPEQCLVLFPDDTARTYEELLLEDEEMIGSDGLTAGDRSSHVNRSSHGNSNRNINNGISQQGWDLVVLDGTWAQARKFHQRYFPETSQGGPRRVQLSAEAVEKLGRTSSSSFDDAGVGTVEGHQLRRHSIAWRQIGTFEATRLFLRDVGLAHTTNPPTFPPDGSATSPVDPDDNAVWSKIQSYQEIANAAAQRELGPPRLSTKYNL